MLYVGVDLHRKRSQVAVVNEAGEVLANRAMPSDGMGHLAGHGSVISEHPGALGSWRLPESDSDPRLQAGRAIEPAL
jgi:hypothetical protein